MIRRYASSKSWQRGQEYYYNGRVRQVVERERSITAEVEGNHYQPYRVSISFDGDSLDKFYCSCPYSFEGICKHQIATLLVCLYQPRIEHHPSLEQILDRLDEVQTQALIRDLVAKKPELIDDIEQFADRLAPLVSVSGDRPQNIIIDVDRFGSDVREDINIYLHEGSIEKAIAIIDDLGYYENSQVEKVMDVAIDTHPDWVIKAACRRAEAILNAGKAKYYEEAIGWLKKARDAYLAGDRKQEWLNYRTKLITIHTRKRKLMGLMKAVV